MKSTYAEFKQQLKQAIGCQTQAEFAAKAKLSAEHLSRMLNDSTICRPSKRTLFKIYGASHGLVSLTKLLESCGYETGREVFCEELDEQSLTESAKQTGFMIREAFRRIIAHRYEFTDWSDLHNTVIRSYTSTSRFHDDVAFEIKPDVYSVEFNEDGLMSATCVCSWTRQNYSFTYTLELAATASVDGFALVHASSPFGEDIVQVSKLKPKKVVAEPTPEERLLQTVFPDLKPKPHMVIGIGFTIDKMPAGRFKQFLARHKLSFIKSSKEKEMYDKFMETGSALYLDDGTDTEEIDSMAKVIAKIISREKFITVVSTKTRPSYEGPVGVMFPLMFPWEYTTELDLEMKAETINVVMDKYAVELMTRFSDIQL